MTQPEIDVDRRHVGAAQVVDHDLVGAAEGLEVDGLDIVEVHGDVGDVAEEARMIAVRRDIDLLGDDRAVEQHRVGAVLAIDGVVVVARVPDEHVVAGAHESDIIAVAAVDQVVAAAADDQIVAEAAIHRQRDLAGRQRAGVDDVVAALAVDGELVVRVRGEQARLPRLRPTHRRSRRRRR